MFPCGEFLKSANNKTRFQFVRFNISRLNIIYISKRRFCQPFATAQFLADTTLNILFQVVRVIFGLTERHLKHKETLRGWFKPKCRKTQRNDFGRVHGVDDAPAVNTITSKSVGMPCENTDITHFLNTHHHFAEHFSSRTLCTFRLLKFLKNFKIFSARKFTKFHKLSWNTHYLFIIIFGALASIEKIFWFGHINCFWIQKKIKLLRSHFLLSARPRISPEPKRRIPFFRHITRLRRAGIFSFPNAKFHFVK